MNSCTYAEETLYSCVKCKRVLPRGTDPKILEIVGGSLLCSACSKTLLPRNRSNGKPCICTVCEKAFTRVDHLIEHFSRHTAEEPHICNVCNAAFARESALIFHDCPYAVEFPFKCDDCPASFAQHFSLKQHVRIHSAGGGSTVPVPRPFVCEVCDKAYTEKATLKRHMLFHTGQKSFACHLCDKTYSRKSILNVHLRQHTGEKPYVCEICGKAFAQRFQIVAHSCEEKPPRTGEKPYVCEVCNKAFAQRFQIVAHSCEERNSGNGKCTTIYVRSPTLAVLKPVEEESRAGASEENASGQSKQPKPLVCLECGEGFSKPYDLKLHLRTHAGERITFKCDACKKTFLKEASLKLHQWCCHELHWNRFKYIKNKD